MSRVAVVTGANKGIGYEIAKKLSVAGCDVVLGCRDGSRGESAKATLQREVSSMGPRVFHVVPLDVTETASIGSAAEAVRKLYPRGIDILVNNAGFAYRDDILINRQRCVAPIARSVPFGKQAEDSIAVNYFGTKAVCEAFIPLVNDGGRIVNVSSMLGRLEGLDPTLQQLLLSPELTIAQLDEMMREFVALAGEGRHGSKGWKDTAYGTSKTGLTILSRLMAQAMPRVFIASCCPGWCRTDMAGEEAPKSAEDGANTPVWLALGSEGQRSGAFFSDLREVPF